MANTSTTTVHTSTINQEELLKIAKLSGINMTNEDAVLFTGQIQKVLEFINQLQEIDISTKQTATSIRNINILRTDENCTSIATNPLDTAPQQKDHYFVVPKILEEKGGGHA